MDPISDILIRIKNAQRSGKASLEVPFSKMKFELAKILAREGLILGVEEKDKKANKKIQINLKYDGDLGAIADIKRKSKSSQRMYVKKDEIRPVKQGRGMAIISTSRGLMTGKEAKKAGLGGELICEIY
ncbi:MAG: 30S ribosomal protein S8 [bacterium]